MNSKQNNKNAMHLAVYNVFKTFPNEIDTIPALKNNVAAFGELLGKIDN
ncbi:hypothetical protein [Carboxylicivirga marina]|uniref:Uncharacterized protein n=1 Tax=Carboxylicivirga marina TaxID=2800988 RepID=A0ABS1HMQ5_9BACT|nr:hypothetical protein [Carboxylicivirga marina]MBK3518973.1 hypothetical protein [Carboxylicivirga marina]